MISGNTYYNETTTPSYDYWDQRPASSLDNDYFSAVKSKKVTIVRQGISNGERTGVKQKMEKLLVSISQLWLLVVILNY